jgi:hypothetical protein
LRTIIASKRGEVARGWRRLHNDELHKFYASPRIKVIKSRMMGWAVFVARMGEMRNSYRILDGRLEGRKHSEDLGVDGKIIFEY